MMSSKNEGQLPPEPLAGIQNKSKILYTREFLLSLSSLDICKNMPIGFDASILRELEDSSSSPFERQRTLGVSSLQSSKRSDYGSLASNRSEGSSSNPRGNTGRWDTRSSGSSDKDADLQSDRDSFTQDPGRRFGNQTRRPWQHPEHDGLLGSGAFPRSSGPGYAGTSAPKARGNDHYQLSRGTEPYQPPRAYKAGAYSRKDSTDSFNDETFGFAEVSSEDRAEEERKRRASFELMRKEQQKALQEKQRVTDNGKEKVDDDIFTLLGNSGYKKSITNRSNKTDDSVAPLLPQNDSSRASFHIQAPSRPLVPPGFASAVTEKNICVQSSGASLSSEGSTFNENDQTRNGIINDQEGRDYSTASRHANLQNDDVKSTSVHSADALENSTIPVSAAEVLKHSVGSEKVSNRTFGLRDYNEPWEGTAVNDLSNTKEARPEIAVDPNHSTSILEKLFGNALSSSSNFAENQDVKAEDEAWSTALSESSKFARWFVEEEKKPVEDLSSRGLLSLITNNEKIGPHSVISSEKGTEINPLTLPSKDKDPVADFLPSPVASSVVGMLEQYYPGDKVNSASGVLTCEDLEQSILAEVKDSSSSLPHSLEGFQLDGKLEEAKADVDNHASKHLLSLLHKGMNLKEFPSSPMIVVDGSSDKLADLDVSASDSLRFVDTSTVGNAETVHSSQKTLTLEALFGAAFMNELHSVEAPLSVKRGSAGEIIDSDVIPQHILPLAHANAGLFSSTSNEYQMNQSNFEEKMAAPKYTRETKAHITPGSWLRYGDSLNEGSKIGDIGSEVGAAEIQLPEEDSLITVGDTLDPRIPDSSPLRNANKEELIPEKTVELLNDKLFNAFLRDGEHLNSNDLDLQPLVRGPCGSVGSSNNYNHLHGRPYPKIPHQINQTSPLFLQPDHLTYPNQQMKLKPQDVNNESHHPFPIGVIPQQAFDIAMGPRFDPVAHHPMLQNMPIPPNFPPHHPIQGVPGVPLSHPINHMPGYIPQMNNVHNFPLHNQQQHFGGFGMGMPGVGGGTHPGALERLIEMELRANSKQMHPAAAGHIPGIYGSELNRNLRYR